MQGTYLGRVGQRLLRTLTAVVGILVVTFFLTRARPDHVGLEVDGLVSIEVSVMHQSLLVQFGRYAVDLFRGDLGQSLYSGMPVLETLIKRLPASLELIFSAVFMAVVTAVPLGVLAAVWPDSRLDYGCRWMAQAGMVLPVLLTGLLLIYLLEYRLGWLPPLREPGFGVTDSLIAGDLKGFWHALQRLVLPAVTLGMLVWARLLLMMRDAMAEALASAFVRMARARGLSRRQVLWTYAFRNAMVPVASGFGAVLSLLLGASPLVESVLRWPGMGAFAVEALAASDVVAVQGFVLVTAVLWVLLRLSWELFAMCLDPRGRADASRLWYSDGV